MTDTTTAPSTFVQGIVKDFYDLHPGQGFFSVSKGDGYRTLNISDLQEVAGLAEQVLQSYEQLWIARVSEFMAALEDLAGQAQDEEETSTPEEAIGWAAAQFREIFKVSEA